MSLLLQFRLITAPEFIVCIQHVIIPPTALPIPYWCPF